jgi:hypothetical protein
LNQPLAIHFGGRNGFFPADSSCDLPEFCEQPAAFHETYLVHLGNDLGEREFEAAADRMAEYLFQNTLAAGAPFFEFSRLLAESGSNENSLAADRLRTVGLAILEPPGPEPAEPESPDAPTDEAGLETHTGAGDTQHLMAPPPSLSDKCKAAVPELVVCGGARQTLVLAPAEVDRERLVQANPGIPQDSLTFVEHGRKHVVICQEISEVPIARVIKQLVGTRRDYGELADRLHTRVDVDWPPLCLAGLD